MPDVIARFSGQHRFLSNFFPAMLVWEGFYWPTSEHAFNGGKTLDIETRIKILAAPTPTEAKRLGGPPSRGGIVQLRPRWDEEVRYQVMAEVLRAKFTCRVEREQKLLATGDAVLEEGNDWHDTHWGICYCSTHGGTGENHLGRLLMELRAQMRHHGGLHR